MGFLRHFGFFNGYFDVFWVFWGVLMGFCFFCWDFGFF